VIEAPNGRIGIALYRHRPTDLVITDIVMPELIWAGHAPGTDA